MCLGDVISYGITSLAAFDGNEFPLLDVELFAPVKNPFVESSGAQGFAAGGSFAFGLPKFLQICGLIQRVFFAA